MMFRFNRWPRLGAAVWLAALLGLDTSPASACSCAEAAEPDVALASSDVVFEGTPRAQLLVEAELGFPGYSGAKRFDFEVARYFKGQLGPSLSVYTIDQGSACGREYPLDEPHIVYARYSDNGLLTDFLCSSSHSSRFGGDGSVLGSGVAPDPAIVNEEDEVDAPEAAEGSSSIRRVPLDTEPEARGCSSALAQPPAPGARPWLAAATGLTLLMGWRLRRRSTR